MLPEGKCRYIDGQIYPDGNFYVLDTQHIKHNGNELKSALNGINTDISNKVDKETGKGLSTNDYTTAEKNKLSGIEANANNYVHPTTSGNKHIPSGGSSGKILGWSADGTAAWVDPASGGGGSVDTVYIGSTEYAPDANGKVTLPTYPTTLPASDVYSWAKASSKPSYTQDEVGDGTTYKRVSATEKTTWNNKGTYSKPSGGIPKTDLTSAVQTSLDKADTALQSFTETDPTVPAWAKAATKPSYTYSEVGAAPTNHNHYQLSTIGDYRSVPTKPNDYPNLMQFKGLKQNSVIGNPSADTYSYVLGLRGWSDSSGGNTHEFAFNNSGIYTRRGASTSWGSWEKLAMTSDIPSAVTSVKVGSTSYSPSSGVVSLPEYVTFGTKGVFTKVMSSLVIRNGSYMIKNNIFYVANIFFTTISNVAANTETTLATASTLPTYEAKAVATVYKNDNSSILTDSAILKIKEDGTVTITSPVAIGSNANSGRINNLRIVDLSV